MQGNFPKTDLEFPFGGGEHHANSKSNNTGFGMCAGTHAGNNLSDLSQVLSRRSRAVLSESSLRRENFGRYSAGVRVSG